MSEELIGLAFFDDAVSNAEKEAMVCRLGRPSVRNILKRLSQLPDDQTFNKILDFVTSNTMRFFKILNFPCDFLKLELSLWHLNESYNEAKIIVSGSQVVNDFAERAVA